MFSTVFSMLKFIKRSAEERKFVENLATEKAAAAQHLEQGTVYTIIKQICGGQRRRKAPICDKQGALLTTEGVGQNTFRTY